MGRFIDDANRAKPSTFPLVADDRMPDLETYGRFRDEIGTPHIVAFYRRGVKEAHELWREVGDGRRLSRRHCARDT
jgi:hypothetical protein